MGKNALTMPGIFLPVNIQSIIYTRVDKEWKLPLHKQSALEFVYCQSGQISVWINGSDYLLSAGDVVLLKSGVYHAGQSHEDSVLFNFHFGLEPGQIRCLLQNNDKPVISGGSKPWNINAREWMDKLLLLVAKESNRTRDGLSDLVQEINDTFWSVKFQIHFLTFFTEIVEGMLQEQEEKELVIGDIQSNQLLVAGEVANYIELHGGEGIQIGYIADKLNFHRNYITRCFTQVYGISPQNYAMQVRIEKAKKLLQQSNLSIHEISDHLSFSTSASFSRFFRSYTGNTPTQFRRGVK
jgi:AraC-like DNA-binding protein